MTELCAEREFEWTGVEERTTVDTCVLVESSEEKVFLWY